MPRVTELQRRKPKRDYDTEEFESVSRLLFNRPTRYWILVTLAVNGPLTVRELARAVGRDSSSIFVIVDSFIEAGILYKSNKPGHRKYVALDRSYSAFEELQRFLIKLDERYPAARTGTPIFRTSFPSRRSRRQERNGQKPELLFGSRLKAWFLLVLRSAGSIHRLQMCNTIKTTITGAQQVIDHGLRSGIILKPGRVGLIKPLHLNPGWFAAWELATLLDRLRALRPIFGALGRAVEDDGYPEASVPRIGRTRKVV
jgi:DNA-binding MarR family transcriptional regulator